jgi:hypothetical protein
MFVICDIGPSCLLRSDVTLLKSVERAKVKNKTHKGQPSDFSTKGYKYSGNP